MTIIAVVGGSGALGSGLAFRWVRAGIDVIIGSRRLESANSAAKDIADACAATDRSGQIRGMINADAAQAADIVVLTVPFAQQDEALAAIAPALRGKILVDTTVPLMPPRVGTVQLPVEGSSALRVQAKVGAEVRVVSAFQNVAAAKLKDGARIDGDVLVCGDDKDARQTVIGLAEAAGLRGFHAGPLANAVAAEALTSVLITINRQFKCHAGVSIVGLGSQALV